AIASSSSQMILAGIWRAMIFSKIVMSRSVSLAQRTIKPHPIGSEDQFFADEADNFLTQRVTSARPCFRSAEMLHTKLQGRKLKIVSAGFDQGVDSLFQQTEKRQLVACAGTMRDIHQRNRNGRGRRCKMPTNLLIADRFQHVAHRLRQLVKGHYVFVVSQVQIKSNTFRHVFSEPPARITCFVSRPRDRRLQPIAVELEQLTGGRPEIWKFFLKRDHDFYLRARAIERLRWSSSALSQGEPVPAEAHLALCGVPACGWHLQIDRHPGNADKSRHNANRLPHRSLVAFQAPLHQSPPKELHVRRSRVRAQFPLPYPPT